MLTVIFSLCVQLVNFHHWLTDDHAPAYVVKHNGIRGLLRTVDFWVKCQYLNQWFYHSISATNGMTKTAKDFRKRLLLPLYLFKMSVTWPSTAPSMLWSNLHTCTIKHIDSLIKHDTDFPIYTGWT